MSVCIIGEKSKRFQRMMSRTPGDYNDGHMDDDGGDGDDDRDGDGDGFHLLEVCWQLSENSTFISEESVNYQLIALAKRSLTCAIYL